VFISFFSFTKINSAQSNQINFAHIFSENGFSQNTVHSIIQDKKGFIWFATEDGLNKFDGYNFTVYKHNPQDTNSISDNLIWVRKIFFELYVGNPKLYYYFMEYNSIK